jgi:FkbM family methyltransferase
VGANVGFFTMIGAKRVGPNGHVVAIEPEPTNTAALRNHSALNGFDGRITVCDSAAGEVDGSAMFDRPSGGCTGRLTSKGSLKIGVVRLDTLAADGAKPPVVVKIDVEGAEAAVLRGSRSLLESARPKLFISTHGREKAEECKECLWASKFTFGPLLGSKGLIEDVLVAQPSSRV